MGNTSSELTLVLRRFAPLARLPDATLERIVRSVKPVAVDAGEFLFRMVDQDHRHFLISGRVRLLDPDQGIHEIAGGDPDAKFALEGDGNASRDCLVLESARVLKVPCQLLGAPVGERVAGNGYRVREIQPIVPGHPDAEVDWMERLLQSPIFGDIPTTSIFDLFQRLERIKTQAGETIIQQGDEAQYFYILSCGRAEVLQQQSDGQTIRLAEKCPGEGFGEEALLSGAMRNAAVRMVTDGEVHRLSAEDFEGLLKAPVLVSLSITDAATLIRKQGGTWLDVRMQDEFQQDPLEDAINLPLPYLRAHAATLDHDRPIVVFCDTGRRSSVAVYLLRERGFDAWLLKGGIAALKGHRRQAG